MDRGTTGAFEKALVCTFEDVLFDAGVSVLVEGLEDEESGDTDSLCVGRIRPNGDDCANDIADELFE